MITLAPILRHDIPHRQLVARDKDLEASGPFDKGFLGNSAEVFDSLYTAWEKSNWWTHFKLFMKTKNGQQAYRTLHALLHGGHKAIASGAAILTQLQSLKYEGDHRNFLLDKYIQMHMKLHNLHADLADYDVDPIPDNL